MKVSVIVPVYNAEAYLAPCIDSILNQTYSNIELVLVNDGSIDNSLSICKSYAQKESRIRLVDKSNGGVSTARNEGLRIAQGEFVTFVDSDDTIPTTAIEVLINGMTDDVDEVVGTFHWQYEDRIIKRIPRLKPGQYSQDELLGGFLDDGTLSGILISSNCCTLYRSSVIKKHELHFDTNLKINEDGLFNFSYFLHSRGVNVIADHVYTTRKHNDSSSYVRPMEYDFNAILLNHIDSLDWDKVRYKRDLQFERRKLTVMIWNILLYPTKLNYKEGRLYIKDQVEKIDINHAYSLLDFSRINKFKRFLLIIIRSRLYSLVYFTVHTLIPLLESKFSR